MSDENPTQTGDLGDQPEPEIEPGEPNPGGVDAVPEDDDTVAGRPRAGRPTRPSRRRPTRSRRSSRRARTPRPRPPSPTTARRGPSRTRSPRPDRWVPLRHERSRAGHRHPGLDTRTRPGPTRAAGGMGVSSERVGPTGPGQDATDGVQATPRPLDERRRRRGAARAGARQRRGEPRRHRAEGGLLSLDPRSEDKPYKDASRSTAEPRSCQRSAVRHATARSRSAWPDDQAQSASPRPAEQAARASGSGAGTPTVGMPRPTPAGARARVRASQASPQRVRRTASRAVGDQVVRGGVGDLDGGDVAGPDLVVGRRRSGRAGCRGRGRRAGGWRRPCGPRPRRPSRRGGGRPASCSPPRRRRRPRRRAAGSGPSRRAGSIWSGSVAAGVPGRLEYWKVKAPLNRACSTTASVCWKSSSVSPGKPTMMSVVMAASGIAARTRSMMPRYFSER